MEQEEQVKPPSSAAASDATTYTADFLEWWSHYPRKVDKGGAFKAWRKIRGVPLEVLVEGADRYANDPNRVDLYTKHPATWLNARAWEDEDALPARRPQGNARPSTDDRVRAGLDMARRFEEMENGDAHAFAGSQGAIESGWVR